MISTQNRLAAANIATSNLKSGTDFSIAAIMARDELSRESSEFSISKQSLVLTLHKCLTMIRANRIKFKFLSKEFYSRVNLFDAVAQLWIIKY